MSMTSNHREATIEADPDVPIIRITRDFAATPAQPSSRSRRSIMVASDLAGGINDC